MNLEALKAWQKKLDFLEVELATASDAEQKFCIEARIAEATKKILELSEGKDEDGHETCQTVVYLDLCHFSEITRSLEHGHQFGPMATKVVQDQIAKLVRDALQHTGNAWDKCFIKGTGDGAILCFPSATSADQFAEALHVRADEHYNQKASEKLEHRCFRVGIYSGRVIRTSQDVSGVAVSFAARLESAAATGEILIDVDSWGTLPPELREKYGPEEQVLGKQHDRPFLVRRRRVGMPSPWTSTGSHGTNGSGLNALDALFEALSGLRGSTGVAEPPGDLGLALSEGKEKVSQLMKDLASEALTGLTLDHVEAVISEAISHGAGIYNHSARGRTGCGEIYFLAASGLLKLGAFNLTAGDAIPSDASLALNWLGPIVKSAGEITDQNGDEVAWELRYCFDAIQLVPRCDEVAMMLRDIARRNDVSLIPRVVRQVVERSQRLPPHVSAYELRHTVRTLLWLCDHQELKDRTFCRAAVTLRKLDQASTRIVMGNAQSLQRELAGGLIDYCQNIEAAGGKSGGLFSWFKS